MKKIFTLVAIAMMAVNAIAQTEAVEYTFNNNADTYVIVDGGTATTYKMDGVEGFSVAYPEANVTLKVALKANENIFWEYKNSSKANNNIVKTGSDFFQADGKNFVLNVKNLKADDVVYIDYTAKGGTDAEMTNAGNTNTVVVEGEAFQAKTDKNTKATFAVKAASNGGIKIKEEGGGYRIYSLRINQVVTGIQNVQTEVATGVKKQLKNGRLVIETANGTYNAVGALVK